MKYNFYQKLTIASFVITLIFLLFNQKMHLNINPFDILLANIIFICGISAYSFIKEKKIVLSLLAILVILSLILHRIWIT